jgi:hypothetical protein
MQRVQQLVRHGSVDRVATESEPEELPDTDYAVLRGGQRRHLSPPRAGTIAHGATLPAHLRRVGAERYVNRS